MSHPQALDLPTRPYLDLVGVVLAASQRGASHEEVLHEVARAAGRWPGVAAAVRRHLPPELRLPASAPEQSLPEVGRGLEVQCLGPLSVRVGGSPVPPQAWRSRKAAELLAYLALAGRPVASSRLVDVLWPEGGDRCMRNLHTTVSRVRGALRAAGAPGSVIRRGRGTYALQPGAGVWLDVLEFERLVDGSEPDPCNRLSPGDLGACRRALDLYEGDLLEGLWEAWVVPPRRTMKEKWFSALGMLARHYLATREEHAALGCYEAMLGRDPCREEAYMGLMRCHQRRGRPDLAVKRYREYCAVLQRELNLPPSPEMARLHYEVLDRAALERGVA